MRLPGRLSVILAVVASGAVVSACGAAPSASMSPAAQARPAGSASAARTGQGGSADAASAAAAPAAAAPAASATASPSPTASPAPPAKKLPPAGNPNGHAPVPAAARAVNTSHPDHVIGHGTPAGCTSRAVVRAVAKGGIITFNCGPAPVTINMTATARVSNSSKRVVLDGGRMVTLSGMGKRRILWMNTCVQPWTTSHCQNQSYPRLTVQNMTFTDGNATGHGINSGSGGAILANGGRLKVVNDRFLSNRCYSKGPDLGGAAIRAFEEYKNRPVYVVHSTFRGGVCANGGALSSIGVSWTVLNTLMAHNRAIGWGANPARSGTPGGGSGGAIYNDGDKYTLTLNGTVIRFCHAREGGGAIFYVSNNKTGTLRIEHSTLHDNPSAGFHNYPGTIFFLGLGKPVITDSHLDG
jgi:hypothetical protein